MNALQRTVLRLGALGVAVLLAACGTSSGLTRHTTELDLSKKSMVLATFEITRSNGRLMPDPRYVSLKGSNAADGTPKLHSIDDEGMEQDTGKPRKTVMLRMALEPGKYNLAEVVGTITGFMAAGTWSVPLNLDFDVPAQSVVYLGRISAHLRERKDGEYRAGPMFPLIDQAALGVSNGTFDVTVSDQSAVDLPRFKDTFSALRNQQIKADILPPFDRTARDRAFSKGAATAKPNASPVGN